MPENTLPLIHNALAGDYSSNFIYLINAERASSLFDRESCLDL